MNEEKGGVDWSLWLFFLVLGVTVLMCFVALVSIKTNRTIDAKSQLVGEILLVQDHLEKQWYYLQQEKKVDDLGLLVEKGVFNIFQASIRLKSAEEWLEKENLADAERYLASAKKYLAENEALFVSIEKARRKNEAKE